MKDDNYSRDDRSQRYHRDDDLEDAIPKPNLSNIESKVPFLTDGFNIIYNKEVPLDIKLETNEETKEIVSFELIRFKLLSDTLNDEGVPQRVKLELSWKSDLLFHYTNIVDENTFLDIKKNKNLI